MKSAYQRVESVTLYIEDYVNSVAALSWFVHEKRVNVVHIPATQNGDAWHHHFFLS